MSSSRQKNRISLGNLELHICEGLFVGYNVAFAVGHFQHKEDVCSVPTYVAISVELAYREAGSKTWLVQDYVFNDFLKVRHYKAGCSFASLKCQLNYFALLYLDRLAREKLIWAGFCSRLPNYYAKVDYRVWLGKVSTLAIFSGSSYGLCRI